jgi:hypothetical protein
MTEGRSFAEVQHDNLNTSLLSSGETYTAAVARGTAQLAAAIEKATGSAAESITAIGTKDYTGATAASAQAAAAAEKLRKKGAAINDAKIAPELKNVRTRTPMGYDRFLNAGFKNFNPNMVNPLARGAFGQTPLLSLADRRAKEDARVAAGGIRKSSSFFAYNAVRQGDRARRKNVEIERLKREETVGRSNELLAKIADSTKDIADDGGLD